MSISSVTRSSCALIFLSKDPKAKLCRVALCASVIFITLGALAIAGLLLPHSPIGLGMAHVFGMSGSMGIALGSFCATFLISSAILHLYFKTRRELFFEASTPSEDSKVVEKSLAIDLAQFHHTEVEELTQQDIYIIRQLLEYSEYSDELTITCGHRNYSISYFREAKIIKFAIDESQTTIEIHLDEKDEIIQIQKDGSELDDISDLDEDLLPLKTELKTLLLQTLHYEIVDAITYEIYVSQKVIEIFIPRESLKIIPESHLIILSRKLIDLMRMDFRGKLFVNFNHGDINKGKDGGGLSREFLDELFQALINSNNLLCKQFNDFYAPHTKIKPQPDRWISHLDDEEKLLFRSMGVILTYCFLSESDRDINYKAYSIGRYFDDALFNAVLCLTEEEIDIPFENLTFQTQLKICKAIVTAGDEDSHLLNIIDLLSKTHLNEQDLQEGIKAAFFSSTLPEDLVREEDTEQTVFERIKKLENKETLVRKALMEFLFSSEGSLGQLGTQIAPIHAMAQGMKLLHQIASPIDSWDNAIQTTSYHDISNKIQGMSIDRSQLVNLIKPMRLSILSKKQKEVIEQKLAWLKEWLQDESEEGASAEDIKKFLKFTTGSSSLPQGKKISIMSQEAHQYSPIPQVYSCAFVICLIPLWVEGEPGGTPGDDSKEKFIETLKTHALNDVKSYSTH